MTLLTEGKAQAAALSYIADNLPEEVSLDATRFPNDQDGKVPNQAFLELDVEWATGTAVQAGKRALHRIDGFINISINIPKGSGDELYTTILDKLLLLFRNNEEFHELGFALRGTEIDPARIDIRNDYFTNTLIIYFYIESF